MITTAIEISLFFFFPVVICALLYIVIRETIIQPIRERSAVYIRTFPKNMYIILVLTVIAWSVSWMYGDDFPQKPLISFLEGSSMSILAAVIFYFFTNHISNIDNRKSAYVAHYGDLRSFTQGYRIELIMFGKYPDPDRDIEERALTFLDPHNGETRWDGLAEKFIPFLTSLELERERLLVMRASMSRIDRSVKYFDQDVRNAFTKIESTVDRLFIDFEKYLASYGTSKDSTVPEKDSIELMYFIRTATILARHTLARIELKKAIERKVKPMIPNKM